MTQIQSRTRVVMCPADVLAGAGRLRAARSATAFCHWNSWRLAVQRPVMSGTPDTPAASFSLTNRGVTL